MTRETIAPQSKFPEQLLSSRQVGFVPAEVFRWTDAEPGKQLAVAELIFPEGRVYVTSAGNNKLDRISANVRVNDKQTDEFGYSRLDGYFLRACRLEANGDATRSERIQIIHTQAREFNNLTIKDYREGPTANARRVYYGTLPLGKAKFNAQIEGTHSPNDLLVVRLGVTDKKNQLAFLRKLTGLNRQALKSFGAGS